MTINIITLGCSKNSVDSEVIAAKLKSLDHQVFFDDICKSDIVLINTCSFIRDAKEESIEEIFLQLERKRKGEVGKVYVIGCLAQRYRQELEKDIPEVDGFYTFAALPALLESLEFNLLTYPDRILSTPPHYAYLKISEGCDRQCAFCAIPFIRGKQISKPIEMLTEEARKLSEQGVKELILIAQDLTYYGMDLSHHRDLDQLMKALAKIDQIEWIRLHYAYPNHFPYEILEVMNAYPQFCHYLDIPLQHISENVLKSMNRPSSPQKMYQLIEQIREKVPDIALRTTLLSGFPTETKKEHKELLQFIQDVRFDRLGVFAYSPEEGTPAFALGDPVKKSEKEKRVEELMTAQEEISLELNEAKEGKIFKVLIDDVEDEFYIGRTEADSPEVDNHVIIPVDTVENFEEKPQVGNFYQVKIEQGDYHDLIGKFVE